MSLINQMLQELDARRSDTVAGTPYGQEIRAVPNRRRIHPAWWLALVLAIVSGGLLARVLLSPPPVAPALPVQLPLKLDAQLGSMASADTLLTAAAAVPAVEPTPPQPLPTPQSLADLRQEDVLGERSAPVPASAPVSRSALPVSSPLAPRPVMLKQPEPEDTHRESPPVESAVSSLASRNEQTVPLTRPTPPAAVRQFKTTTPVQRAENAYRRAVDLIQQGKNAEALPILERLLQAEPHQSDARQALIRVLLDMQRHDEALRRAMEGLMLDRAQPELAMIAARLQLEDNALGPAIETLERTLPYADDRADYQAFLAALLQRDGQHKQAVERYELALRRGPQQAVWWMGLGISLQAERRLPEAQEAYKRARNSGSLSPELQAFIDTRLRQMQR